MLEVEGQLLSEALLYKWNRKWNNWIWEDNKFFDY